MYLKYLKFQFISLLNIHTDQFSMYISDELVLIKNVDFYFPGHFKINAIKKLNQWIRFQMFIYIENLV